MTQCLSQKQEESSEQITSDCKTTASQSKHSDNTASISLDSERHQEASKKISSLSRHRRSGQRHGKFSSTEDKRGMYSFSAMRGRRGQELSGAQASNSEMFRAGRAPSGHLGFSAMRGRRGPDYSPIAGEEDPLEDGEFGTQGGFSLQSPDDYLIVRSPAVSDLEDQDSLVGDFLRTAEKAKHSKRFSPSSGSFSAMRGKKSSSIKF